MQYVLCLEMAFKNLSFVELFPSESQAKDRAEALISTIKDIKRIKRGKYSYIIRLKSGGCFRLTIYGTEGLKYYVETNDGSEESLNEEIVIEGKKCYSIDTFMSASRYYPFNTRYDAEKFVEKFIKDHKKQQTDITIKYDIWYYTRKNGNRDACFIGIPSFCLIDLAKERPIYQDLDPLANFPITATSAGKATYSYPSKIVRFCEYNIEEALMIYKKELFAEENQNRREEEMRNTIRALGVHIIVLALFLLLAFFEKDLFILWAIIVFLTFCSLLLWTTILAGMYRKLEYCTFDIQTLTYDFEYELSRGEKGTARTMIPLVLTENQFKKDDEGLTWLKPSAYDQRRILRSKQKK